MGKGVGLISASCGKAPSQGAHSHDFVASDLYGRVDLHTKHVSLLLVLLYTTLCIDVSIKSCTVTLGNAGGLGRSNLGRLGRALSMDAIRNWICRHPSMLSLTGLATDSGIWAYRAATSANLSACLLPAT